MKDKLVLLFILVLAFKPGWIMMSSESIDPHLVLEVVDELADELHELPPKEAEIGY